MLTLNNKKFAETEQEFTDSLFKKGGTCTGYAKRLKRQVQLFDHHHKQIGVINKNGVLCCVSFPKVLKGKKWYSFATIKEIGKLSLMEEFEQINKLVINKNHTGLFFK